MISNDVLGLFYVSVLSSYLTQGSSETARRWLTASVLGLCNWQRIIRIQMQFLLNTLTFIKHLNVLKTKISYFLYSGNVLSYFEIISVSLTTLTIFYLFDTEQTIQYFLIVRDVTCETVVIQLNCLRTCWVSSQSRGALCQHCPGSIY